MNQLTEKLLSESWVVGKWPKSKCRNCDEDLRLYSGRWYHVTMYGGSYHKVFANCDRPWPLKCKGCGAAIDYRTMDVGYYDFNCNSCIEKQKQGDKIGILTPELRKKLRAGKGDYLQYGTMVAAVVTKNGIWFVDIC